MRLDELKFLQGEKRYLQFEVFSTKNEKVVVTDAKYEMSHDGVVVDSGNCEILDDSMLQVLIDAENLGSYDLEITYTITPEIRKIRCKLHVC